MSGALASARPELARGRHLADRLRPGAERVARRPYAAALVRQHDVAPGGGDPPDLLRTVLGVGYGGHAQRKGQGVPGVPVDLRDGPAVQRVRRHVDLGEPHGLAISRVGVGRVAGQRALRLGQHEHHAGGELQMRADEGGAGGPRRQAGPRVAPGVKRHFRERPVERGRGFGGLEEHGPRVDRLLVGEALMAEERRCRAGVQRGAAGAGGQRGPVRRRRAEQDAEPGPRVGALADRVVDEAGVPAGRRAQPGRAEVGLGGDHVLAVAELIRDVGEHLDHDDAEVRRVALRPERREQREPVEHHLHEAGVVLGQVVDGRRGHDVRRALGRLLRSRSRWRS